MSLLIRAGFFNPAPKKTFLRTLCIITTESPESKENSNILFDGFDFALYTAGYENTEQIFFAPVGRNFCHVVAGADRIGVDGTDYVHAEILAQLWYCTQ